MGTSSASSIILVDEVSDKSCTTKDSKMGLRSRYNDCLAFFSDDDSDGDNGMLEPSSCLDIKYQASTYEYETCVMGGAGAVYQ